MAKTNFTKRDIEKLTGQMSTRKTAAKLPHYFDGLTEVGDKDPITQNLIGVIEEQRAEYNKLYQEVEMVKAYIYDAFGAESAKAASQGAKGDKGNTGSTGSQGPTGPTGATGNSHLSGITSISIDSKTGDMGIVTGGKTYVYSKKAGK